jgi:hypothetical protein
VVRRSVLKVLGTFPVHPVHPVIDTHQADPTDVASVVLPDELVMPIELVLDQVRRVDAVVTTIGQECIATVGVRQEASLIVSLDVPRMLAVGVHAKPFVVMENIALDLSEGCVLRTDRSHFPIPCFPLSKAMAIRSRLTI